MAKATATATATIIATAAVVVSSCHRVIVGTSSGVREFGSSGLRGFGSSRVWEFGSPAELRRFRSHESSRAANASEACRAWACESTGLGKPWLRLHLQLWNGLWSSDDGEVGVKLDSAPGGGELGVKKGGCPRHRS
jgi:Tfp pilus assembly protein PilV